MNITYHVLAIETYLGPINFIIFCIFSDLCTESKEVEMAVSGPQAARYQPDGKFCSFA